MLIYMWIVGLGILWDMFLTNVGVSGSLSHTPKGTLTDSLPSGYATIGDIEYKVNVNSATKLQTARQINGTNFDGTANITTAKWGTARSIKIGNTAKNVDGSANVTWTFAEIGGADAGHTHGLLHNNFATTIANTTTDSGWSMINGSYNGFILKSLRTQDSAPSWTIGNYSAGICFGGADTKGVITVAFNEPLIRMAGGNGSKPVWNFSIRGVNGTTYDLNNFTAAYAKALPTNYIGGKQSNPQAYFSGNVGLKVAMTGMGNISTYWSDTLWIKGYNGADVKGTCALHFSKGAPRFSISFQNFDSTTYGTAHEVWTTYNFNPKGSKTRPVVLFSGQIYRSGSSWYVDSGKSSQISGTGTLTVSITSARMTITLPSAKITSASIHICDSTKVSGSSTANTSGRSEGPFWFSVYENGANYIYVRPFCQGNSNNDSWLSQNSAWTSYINRLTVTLFGYV